jgi:hypothetical protein
MDKNPRTRNRLAKEQRIYFQLTEERQMQILSFNTLLRMLYQTDLIICYQNISVEKEIQILELPISWKTFTCFSGITEKELAEEICLTTEAEYLCCLMNFVAQGKVGNFGTFLH